MYYIVVHRISRNPSEQVGPFTSEAMALEWIGNNGNRNWLGCDIVKLPGTVEQFRVELLTIVSKIGFNPKVRIRVVDSIADSNATKLVELAKLLMQVKREADYVSVLKKALRNEESGSCEHCPNMGGGCVVCN